MYVCVFYDIDYGDVFRQICAGYSDSSIVPRSGRLEITFLLQNDVDSAIDDCGVIVVANKGVTDSFFQVQEYITDNQIKDKLIN